MWTREGSWEVYKAARDESCFYLKASLYPKEERKRQKKNSGMRITKGYSVARDVHESWKKIKYVCVFVGLGLRSTSFVLGVAKKSEVPICSARTSLTYPSSFCQAGTRTTAGDPWLCKCKETSTNY